MKFPKIKLPKIKIPVKATRTVGKVLMAAKRHEAEICTIAGVIVSGGAVVAGAKGTVKAIQLRNEYADVMNTIEEVHDAGKVEEYTDEVYEEDKRLAKRNFVLDVLKSYAPAAGMFVCGTVFVLGGMGIMKRRNVALVAAYNGIQNSFAEYRSRVADHVGEEVEDDIYNGRETIVAEEVTDIETGETKILTASKVIERGAASPYARLFDKNNVYFENDVQYNLMILNRIESELNELLYDRGYLFLNEALVHLGFEPVLAGQSVGWLLHGNGDGVVSFGLTREKIHEFINSDAHEIWIDLNVDGPILDNIPDKLMARI